MSCCGLRCMFLLAFAARTDRRPQQEGYKTILAFEQAIGYMVGNVRPDKVLPLCCDDLQRS